MEKLSKNEVKKSIEEFFRGIENKSPQEIKQVKKLAMRHNIKLKEKRKKFCKKCFFPYRKPNIRVKKDVISVTCENCEYITRWKIE
jgi:RNase P subunit RPR2